MEMNLSHAALDIQQVKRVLEEVGGGSVVGPAWHTSRARGVWVGGLLWRAAGVALLLVLEADSLIKPPDELQPQPISIPLPPRLVFFTLPTQTPLPSPQARLGRESPDPSRFAHLTDEDAEKAMREVSKAKKQLDQLQEARNRHMVLSREHSTLYTRAQGASSRALLASSSMRSGASVTGGVGGGGGALWLVGQDGGGAGAMRSSRSTLMAADFSSRTSHHDLYGEGEGAAQLPPLWRLSLPHSAIEGAASDPSGLERDGAAPPPTRAASIIGGVSARPPSMSVARAQRAVAGAMVGMPNGLVDAGHWPPLAIALASPTVRNPSSHWQRAHSEFGSMRSSADLLSLRASMRGSMHSGYDASAANWRATTPSAPPAQQLMMARESRESRGSLHRAALPQVDEQPLAQQPQQAAQTQQAAPSSRRVASPPRRPQPPGGAGRGAGSATSRGEGGTARVQRRASAFQQQAQQPKPSAVDAHGQALSSTLGHRGNRVAPLPAAVDSSAGASRSTEAEEFDLDGFGRLASSSLPTVVLSSSDGWDAVGAHAAAAGGAGGATPSGRLHEGGLGELTLRPSAGGAASAAPPGPVHEGDFTELTLRLAAQEGERAGPLPVPAGLPTLPHLATPASALAQQERAGAGPSGQDVEIGANGAPGPPPPGHKRGWSMASMGSTPGGASQRRGWAFLRRAMRRGDLRRCVLGARTAGCIMEGHSLGSCRRPGIHKGLHQHRHPSPSRAAPKPHSDTSHTPLQCSVQACAHGELQHRLRHLQPPLPQ